MHLRTLLRTLTWLAGIVATIALARPLVFSPAPGTTLEKRLSQHWEVRLDDIRLAVDGRDLTDLFLPGLEIETELTQLVQVTDTYHSLRRGRPQSLDRAFDAISEELEVTLSSDSWKAYWNEQSRFLGSSELEGRVVEFRWSDGEYDLDYQRDSDPEDLERLAGLREDMDLRCLLPSEEVEIGDSWDLDLESLPDLLSPGGYLAWDVELEGSAEVFADLLDPALMGDLRELFGRHLHGAVSATYLDEEDGISLLELSIDVRTVKDIEDLRALAKKLVGTRPEWGSQEIEELEIDLELVARGTARWDTRRGHLISLELSGELDSRMELVLLWGFDRIHRIELGTQVTAEFEQQFLAR